MEDACVNGMCINKTFIYFFVVFNFNLFFVVVCALELSFPFHDNEDDVVLCVTSPSRAKNKIMMFVFFMCQEMLQMGTVFLAEKSFEYYYYYYFIIIVKKTLENFL